MRTVGAIFAVVMWVGGARDSILSASIFRGSFLGLKSIESSDLRSIGCGSVDCGRMDIIGDENTSSETWNGIAEGSLAEARRS